MDCHGSYNLHVLLKKQKPEQKMREEKKKKNQNSYIKIVTCSKGYRIFISSLIFGTFILFGIIPFILVNIHNHVLSKKYTTLYRAITMIFPLSMLADAAVYIFSLKQVRRKLPKGICKITVKDNRKNVEIMN